MPDSIESSPSAATPEGGTRPLESAGSPSPVLGKASVAVTMTRSGPVVAAIGGIGVTNQGYAVVEEGAAGSRWTAVSLGTSALVGAIVAVTDSTGTPHIFASDGSSLLHATKNGPNPTNWGAFQTVPGISASQGVKALTVAGKPNLCVIGSAISYGVEDAKNPGKFVWSANVITLQPQQALEYHLTLVFPDRNGQILVENFYWTGGFVGTTYLYRLLASGWAQIANQSIGPMFGFVDGSDVYTGISAFTFVALSRETAPNAPSVQVGFSLSNIAGNQPDFSAFRPWISPSTQKMCGFVVVFPAASSGGYILPGTVYLAEAQTNPPTVNQWSFTLFPSREGAIIQPNPPFIDRYPRTTFDILPDPVTSLMRLFALDIHGNICVAEQTAQGWGTLAPMGDQASAFYLINNPQGYSQLLAVGENGLFMLTHSAVTGGWNRTNLLMNVSDPATPTLLTISYDGNLTLTARWTPLPGITDYLVGIFHGTQMIASGPGFGLFTTVTLPSPIDPNSFTQVAVATNPGGHTGAFGNRLVVVVDAVTGLSATCVGTRQVSAQWTLPSGKNVTGAALTLRDTTANAAVAEQSFSGSSGTLDLPAALNTQHNYALTAQGSYGPSFGPATAPLALVVVAPQLVSAVYSPSRNRIEASLAFPVPDGCSPGLALFGNDNLLQLAQGQGTLVNLVLAGALDPSIAYRVRPYWWNGNAIGPYGPGYDVLVTAPSIKEVQFSGTALSLEWTNLPGPPYPTGGQVVISAPHGNEPNRSQFFIGANRGQFTPAPALNPGTAYAIAVASLRGKSQGPFGPSLAVIASQKSVARVIYDGRMLSASWAGGDGPGVTGYLLLVFQGSAIIARQAANGSGGALNVPLDPAGVYTVALQAVGLSSSGPIGPTVAAISAVPGVSAAVVTATTVTVSIVPPSSTAGITQYQAFLYRGGDQVASSPPVAGGGSPSAVITFATAGQSGYSVRVQGLGGANISGPLSPFIPLLSAPPVVEQALIQGTTLTVAWRLPAAPAGAITASTVTITPSQGQAVVFPNLPGTSAVLTLDANLLQPTLGYNLTITCTGPRGATPPSIALPLIPSAPSFSQVSYDGQQITAIWKWPVGATGAGLATGYLLLVSHGGAVIARQAASGSTAVFDVLLDPAGVYTVALQAIGMQTSGPIGPAAAVISAIPSMGTVIVTTTTLTVAVVPPASTAGITQYQAFLYRGDHQVASSPPVAAGSSPSAVITFATAGQGGYLVRVQGLGSANGTKISGPLSPSIPVLSAPPVAEQASIQGNTLTVAWRLPAAPAGAIAASTVTITPSQGQPVVFPNLPGTSAVLTLAVNFLQPTLGYNLTIVCTGPSGTTPASIALPLIPSAPSFSQVSYDGRQITAAWQWPAGATGATLATGYQLLLSLGRAPLQSVEVSGLSGTFTPHMPMDGNVPLDLTVTATIPSSAGPASASVPLIGTYPTVTAAATNPVTGATTVSWTPVSFTVAVQYLVQLFLGGAPQGAPLPASGTSLVLPNGLTPGADMAIAVAASATVAATSVTGAYGPHFALPTGQPRITSVDYHGSSVDVAWTPVARATGYIISVVMVGSTESLAKTTVPAGTTRTSLPVAISDLNKIYNVFVQAALNASSGPLSAPVPLFAPGFYFSTANNLPCVFLATTLALAPAPTTAFLPNIGTLTGLPIAPQQGSDPAPFTLATNPDTNTNTAFPYLLTIANAAIAFTSARATLADLYVTLLTTAETHGAKPWGLFQLQQVIARLMPQTFAETLFYAYGMLPTSQHADLRPGMILRVAFSEFDLLPGNKPPAWAAGYAGSAVVDYEVGDYYDARAPGGWLVGFDAFLAWLTANTIVTVPQPVTENPPPVGPAFAESGGAEAADLFFPAFRQPFYRLFFPAVLQSSNAAANSRTAQQFAIAAAGTFAAITGATTAPVTNTVSVALFRGRAVLKLCIRVVINGVEEIVPIGTTVGNLLDRLARRPPSTAIALRGLRLERSLGPVVLNPAAPYDISAGYRVRFDWQTLATLGPWHDVLSLPLLHGDHLTIGPQ